MLYIPGGHNRNFNLLENLKCHFRFTFAKCASNDSEKAIDGFNEITCKNKSKVATQNRNNIIGAVCYLIVPVNISKYSIKISLRN